MDTEDFLKRRFAKDDSIVSRNIGGEVILVPVRRKAADLSGIYTLNEVGARIWELMDGQRTGDDVAAVIFEEYDVDSEEMQQDLADLVRQLLSLGALKEA